MSPNTDPSETTDTSIGDNNDNRNSYKKLKSRKTYKPVDTNRFFCPYPNCNRSFIDLWRLKVHYRADPNIRGSGKERGHGKELPSCPKCNKSLERGRHHVNCVAGKAAPSQSNRRLDKLYGRNMRISKDHDCSSTFLSRHLVNDNLYYQNNNQLGTIYSNESKSGNFESLLTNSVIPVSYYGQAKDVISLNQSHSHIENQQNMSSSNCHHNHQHQQATHHHHQLSSDSDNSSHVLNNLILDERNQLVTGGNNPNQSMPLMPVDPSQIFSTIPENVKVEDCHVTSGYAVFIDVDNYSKVYFIPVTAAASNDN